MGVKKRSVRIWSWMVTSLRVDRGNPDVGDDRNPHLPLEHNSPSNPPWQLHLFCDMIVLPW